MLDKAEESEKPVEENIAKQKDVSELDSDSSPDTSQKSKIKKSKTQTKSTKPIMIENNDTPPI